MGSGKSRSERKCSPAESALSRRGAFLARIGLVRLALKLLLAGSHAIPKLVSRALGR